MFITLLLVVCVAVIAIFVAIARQPSEFRVERTATIAASPAALFGQVNDFHHWEAWSPWAKLDPSAKNTFGEISSGKGAAFAWSGNSKVGEGRMTITTSRPGELIEIRLEFTKPFKATNQAAFTFKPKGDKTLVTWSMAGRNNLVSKAIGLFMNCDKMVGGQFEKGLENLRSVTERPVRGEGQNSLARADLAAAGPNR